MRLRYLHLQNYPPISDSKVCFASGGSLGRECAIRFVVGLNGSGKSNLLRAVAELFLALSDERIPPFPITLIYELGMRGRSRHFTFVVDCPSTKAEAAVWVAEGWHWPDTEDVETFESALSQLRETGQYPHFRAHITRGTWPQQPGIAMPAAILAYTTGDLHPWRSVWDRNQDAQGIVTDSNGETEPSEERPAAWSIDKERTYQTSRDEEDPTTDSFSLQKRGTSPLYRRPILLDATLLKCALLALALPQAVNGETKQNNELEELLKRGNWHHLVSVVFHCHLQTAKWSPQLSETAHDLWYCAGEVIAEPHPVEPRRAVLFDIKGHLESLDLKTYNGELASCATQGDALWNLLGGASATPFEIFTRLLELNQAGLFDDVLLRLRSQPAHQADVENEGVDIGVLRYEELSDGEQMVLGRMALFHLLQNQHDALLLLDEPETHFNDKWKREIVDIIDDAIGNTANDVLISTHSSIVLSDVFNDEIVMVEKTAQGTGVRSVGELTFATDPSALMMTIFEAEDSIGKRAQEYIETKLKQTTGTAEDIVDLEQLISRMGTGFYRSELRTLINTWKEQNA